MSERQVWIADFGSQYTQLITRRARELGYSSEIMTVEKARQLLSQGHRPKALVLSGGPQSLAEDKTDYSFCFQDQRLPVLGICYGMQIIGQYFGGHVEPGHAGEYGQSEVHFEGSGISGIPDKFQVWMSHFDHVSRLPDTLRVRMRSKNGFLAMVEHKERPVWGLQFHPEVEHSQFGRELLRTFFEQVAKLKKDWSSGAMMQEALDVVKSAGAKNVLCAFSGGVDSLVAASLAHRELGERLHCFFVDHGLLRPQDYGHIKVLQAETPLNIVIIDARELFMKNLSGQSDPEQKRKTIGRLFIEVFEQKVHEYERARNIKFDYLLQGTLYPDVIESISPHEKDGKSATIKSHHNVGGLPERMKLQLLEPLRYLFKDEVRTLGESLGLKFDWIHRHPFPGPGIGIRVLGQLSEKAIAQVGQSDQILYEELKHHGIYQAVWQAFTVLLPVNTVGVKGDARAYEQVICVRLVNSSDGMTAHWSHVPYDFLSKVSSRITNEVKGITRVVYDITSKPPGTIEWE